MNLEQRMAELEHDLRATKAKTAIAIGIALAALAIAVVQLLASGA